VIFGHRTDVGRNVRMPKISYLMGLIAEKLETMPRVRRFAARTFVVLRRNFSKLGIGLPRQTPAGLRKLRGLYRDRAAGAAYFNSVSPSMGNTPFGGYTSGRIAADPRGGHHNMVLWERNARLPHYEHQ
jgi:hypothetical protein